MNIRQRGPNVWQCTWDLGRDPVTGKRRRRYEEVEGARDEAAAYWLRVAREIKQGTMAERAPWTVETWMTHWLELKQDLRPRTARRYRQHVTHQIIPTLGPIRLDRLTPADIQTAIQHWGTHRADGKAGTLAPRTVAHAWQVLHGGLSLAVQWKIIATNPADYVILPRIRRPRPHWWTPEETQRFLAATEGTRWHLAWRLVLETGLREGEVLGLRWEDVDWDRGWLVVRRAVDPRGQEEAPKTERGVRLLALDDAMVAVLRQAHAAAPGDWVVGTRHNTPVRPRNLARAFTAAQKAAGVPLIRFHDLRHTNASLLLEAGTDPKIVSERLGHSSVAFTMDTYVHARTELQRPAAEALGRLLRPDDGVKLGRQSPPGSVGAGEEEPRIP